MDPVFQDDSRHGMPTENDHKNNSSKLNKTMKSGLVSSRTEKPYIKLESGEVGPQENGAGIGDLRQRNANAHQKRECFADQLEYSCRNET